MLELVTVKDPLDGLGILQIQSLMYWPGDEAGQNDFLAAAYKVQQVHLETKPLEARNDPALQEHLYEWSQMIGGWQGIADSSPLRTINPKIANRYAEGQITGLVLALFYSWCQTPNAVTDRPSKNKLCYLLEDLGHQIIGRTVERKDVFTQWKRFGSVAHFWAAQYILRQFGDDRPGATVYGFNSPTPEPPEYSYDDYVGMWKRLLVIADKLQDFGIHYTPVGGNEPLLDPLNTFLLLLPPEWEAEIPEMPFPEAFRESISAYQAPK